VRTTRHRKPNVGDHLYRDNNGDWPVTVIATLGQKVFFVNEHVDIGSTHVGNLFDASGDRPFYL
jgi:hypothetical protein